MKDYAMPEIIRTGLLQEKQTKHVIFDDYAVLTPKDPEKYLQTIGVSTCTALVLHFPKNGVLALAHILPTGSLQSFLHRIKRDLEGKIDGAPTFFMQDGPLGDLKSQYSHLEIRTSEDILLHFPNAVPTEKVLRDPIKQNELYINLTADKESGEIQIHSVQY